MKVVPIGDKLVLKRAEGEDVTSGGIVLPDSTRERPQHGRVLSVGDGKLLPDGTHVAPEINEGDRVVFSAYAGAEVTVDGEELLILNVDEVLAVLK